MINDFHVITNRYIHAFRTLHILSTRLLKFRSKIQCNAEWFKITTIVRRTKNRVYPRVDLGIVRTTSTSKRERGKDLFRPTASRYIIIVIVLHITICYDEKLHRSRDPTMGYNPFLPHNNISVQYIYIPAYNVLFGIF